MGMLVSFPVTIVTQRGYCCDSEDKEVQISIISKSFLMGEIVICYPGSP